jgi:hypothetical protein
MAAVLILGLTLFSANLNGVRSAPALTTKTLVLYDAALGSMPSAPLMGFLDFPQNVAMPAYIDGATVMDTTTAGSDTYAGWVSTGTATPEFPILNRVDGFQVRFVLQIEEETHESGHRAGFSLIVLGEDTKGIELAFWEDQIWAQGDDGTGGLFRRAETAPYATTSGLIEYQLMIQGDTYTLMAEGIPILSGPVRDYSAFSGFPDPYETPNFLFLGDDTTSARARVRLSFVSMTGTEPPVPTATVTITDLLLPTASHTPAPATVPMPSPIPSARGGELCSSIWILLPGVLLVSLVKRRNKIG